MSNLRSSLVGSLCLTVSLFAGAAKADCQAFLAPYFQWLEKGGDQGGTSVGFTYVAMQPDKAAPVTYTTTPPNGESHGLMKRINSTSMGSSFSNNTGARQLFSDRKVGDQPFSVNNPNLMHHQVDQDGTVWFISPTGAVVGQISNPVCENGLLYGWGPSLSTFTSPTMYVFRFFQGIVLN